MTSRHRNNLWGIGMSITPSNAVSWRQEFENTFNFQLTFMNTWGWCVFLCQVKNLFQIVWRASRWFTVWLLTVTWGKMFVWTWTNNRQTQFRKCDYFLSHQLDKNKIKTLTVVIFRILTGWQISFGFAWISFYLFFGYLCHMKLSFSACNVCGLQW